MADFSPDFNLRDIIKDLPAARFLWYNLVSEENEERYLTILGELLQLFITPHEYPIYPYKEASYLKKYEHLFATEVWTRPLKTYTTFMDCLVAILQLENPAVQLCTLQNVEIDVNTLNDTDPGRSFTTVIVNWFFNSPARLFLLPFAYVDSRFPRDQVPGHSVLLALQKGPANVLKYVYFNAHGYMERSVMEYEFVTKLHDKLENMFPGMRVVQMVTNCPELQLYEQGGNCVQHSALFFSLLTLNPDYFDDIDTLLSQLEAHVTLNITLFSLSIFLRTMPYVTLQKYYYHFSLHKGEDFTLKKQKEWLTDSVTMATSVSSAFGGVNCPNLPGDHCSLSFCSECKGKCRFRSGIEDVEVQRSQPQPVALEEAKQASSGDEEEEFNILYDCKVLNPKEMAAKMFRLYFELKDMTVGIEPLKLSFMAEQMEDMLNFPTPRNSY